MREATRCSAVELLRSVASREALVWIPEFLADDDPSVRSWGLGVLDQLAFRERIVDEEAEPLLVMAEQHSSKAIRAQAASIRLMIEQMNDDKR